MSKLDYHGDFRRILVKNITEKVYQTRSNVIVRFNDLCCKTKSISM